MESGDLTKQKVVSQLGEIIKGRYGCGLRLQQISGFSENFKDIHVSDDRQEVQVSLKHDDLFLGRAILNGISILEDKQIEVMVDLVKMTLEPVLYNEFLVLQEHNTSILSSKIFPAEEDIFSGSNPYHADLDQQEEVYGSKLTHSLLAIQSDSADFARRVALELHEQSGLWSFVQLSDLRSSVKNLSELNELNQISIFVSEEDLQDNAVVEWVNSLKSNVLKEKLLVLHLPKNSSEQFSDLFQIPADRLSAHRLTRIESLQMLLKRTYQS